MCYTQTHMKKKLPLAVDQAKAYVLTVDMGYGHQRAVYPLTDMAISPPSIASADPLITANTYPGIPERDRRWWSGGRTLYETISRLKNIPIIGDVAFGLMDYMQRIEPFYPRRDLSAPTAQLRQIYSLIGRGWGRDLIVRLNESPRPLITSFFTLAYFAEEHRYDGPIYCLCTDTDVSRAWAPLHPQKTRINYLAPNRRVKERLMLYGVPEAQILVTGFPLPKELVGEDGIILKQRLGCRLSNLDPEFRYQKKYQQTIREYLGTQYCDLEAEHPLTISFAVGGAGAQRDIGVTILESLHAEIDAGTLRLNLIAGTRPDVFRYYDDAVRRLHLDKGHHGSVAIVYGETKLDYFKKCSDVLATTDILWTKPSEMSFYAGLGLPIIMCPPVGAQEDFNKDWLLSIGAGFMQEDPRYAHEWLHDWLRSGWLAQAAMNGFMNAPHNGALHIADIVLHGKKSEIENVHLL